MSTNDTVSSNADVCLYPDCCVSGTHETFECHTPEMAELARTEEGVN